MTEYTRNRPQKSKVTSPIVSNEVITVLARIHKKTTVCSITSDVIFDIANVFLAPSKAMRVFDTIPTVVVLRLYDTVNHFLAEHYMPCLSKQCRSRSAGFLRSQLVWICTVCYQICELDMTPLGCLAVKPQQKQTISLIFRLLIALPSVH